MNMNIRSIRKIAYYVLHVSIMSMIVGMLSSGISLQAASFPWTIEKAEQLARKTLFSPIPSLIQELYDAGSATGAVALLFPDPVGPSTGPLQTTLNNLTTSLGFSIISRDSMNRYYQLSLLKHPYEAKIKLGLLLRDIHAVNKQDNAGATIGYNDVEEQFTLIHQHTLGSYKDFIKRLLYNNGGRGDYAPGRFTDLVNPGTPPNENYARELLQLFLMGEYRPFDDPAVDQPNYTDEDVRNLAKALTYLQTDLTNQVYFIQALADKSTGLVILSGALKTGVNFPFYDSVSGVVNLNQIDVSLNGNNGRMDNIIDYIFAKREKQIAELLAFRLFQYYIHMEPTSAQVDEFSDKIIEYDFALFDSVTWLLQTDWMYETVAFDTIHYKNPVELVMGALKLLYQNDPNGIPAMIYDQNLLSTIGREPYYPGSVFGRDGFELNKAWMNQYLYSQWIRTVSRLVFQDSQALWSGRFAIDGPTGLFTGSIPADPYELIDMLTGKFYFSRSLSAEIVSGFVDYLTSGGMVTYDPTNSGYKETKIRGLIGLILIQPEFVLQGGWNVPTTPPSPLPSVIQGNGRIIFLELFGGYDWIYGIISKQNYEKYVMLRSILRVPLSNMIDIGEYLINNVVLPFKQLYDDGNMIFINGVGNPFHSRGHDTAQRQSTSAYNQQQVNVEGLFGHIIKDDIPENTFVIGTNKPNIFNHGQYINIGQGSSKIEVTASWASLPSNPERDAWGMSVKNILNTRAYPEKTPPIFEGAVLLDTIAYMSGPVSPGWNLSGQLAYIKKLMDNNLGWAYYAMGGGGFDTHALQNEVGFLDKKMENISQAVKIFFDDVKNDHDVTIIIHTEFGRTIQRNGTDGTDHGQGGGFFIISNNPNILTEFSDKIYGIIDIAKIFIKHDWLGVGIDYRAVYRKVFEALYSTSFPTVSPYTLDVEINTYPPEFALFRSEYKANNNNAVQVNFLSKVEDVNYEPTSKAGNVIVKYGNDPATLEQWSSWEVRNRVIMSDEDIRARRDWQTHGSTRFFDITAMDNQHVFGNISGKVVLPTIYASGVFTVNQTHDSLLRSYENTIVSGPTNLGTPLTIPAGTGQVTGYAWLYAPSLTTVTGLDGSGEWNGAFLWPQDLIVDAFISQQASYMGDPLNLMNIPRIVRVGPDTLGVQMYTSQPVDITVKNLVAGEAYDVLTTMDGYTWTLVTGGVTGTSNPGITFSTDTLGVFAIVSTTIPSCEIVVEKLAGMYNYALTWRTANTVLAQIDNSIGVVTGATGQVQLTGILPNTIYTYTMTVTSSSTAQATCQVSLDTDETITLATPVCSLSAVAASPAGRYTFSWTSTDAFAANINHENIGDVAMAQLSFGTATVFVGTGPGSYPYTMTTVGAEDEGVCTTTITIAPPPVPTPTPTPTPGGGGGNSLLQKDNCPDGDFSPTYYDGTCGTPSDMPSGGGGGGGGGDSTSVDTVQAPMQQKTQSASDYIKQKLSSPVEKHQNNPENILSLMRSLDQLIAKKLQEDSISPTAKGILEYIKGLIQPYRYYLSNSDLVKRLHANGLTMFNTVDAFRPDEFFTREQAARFMSVFAQKQLNMQYTVPASTCRFTDIRQADVTLVQYIEQSCRLGIFRGSNGRFMPKQNLTIAQTIAVVGRMIDGMQSENHTPWYIRYLDVGEEKGYMPFWYRYFTQTESSITRIHVGWLLHFVARMIQ